MHKPLEKNFLGDVITSINQQQRQKLSLLEMKKGSPNRKVEPQVRFTSHHPQGHGKEGQIGSSDHQEDDKAEVHIIFQKDTHAAQVSSASQATSASKPCASLLSEYVASEGDRQLSPMSSSAKGKPRSHRVQWQQPRSLFYVNLSAAERAQGASQQRAHLWSHSCDSDKLVEKASLVVDECHKKPLSVNTERTAKCELKGVNCGHLHCSEERKCDTSAGSVKKNSNYSSSNNGSTKSESGNLDDNRGSKSRSHRRKEKKSAKSSEKESNACSHKASDTNDVVANASKTEVYCMLCGITLSKPQCFYSLGSLCTDGEFCETDSDDVNRHPVGDIDDEPPLVDIQSHHDTGYTSSDDFENESTFSKDLNTAWLQMHDKRETDSYDGDYESDSEETGLKPDTMSDKMALKPLASVGEPIAIKDYALREWKSDTPTSKAMKKVNCLSKGLLGWGRRIASVLGLTMFSS